MLFLQVNDFCYIIPKPVSTSDNSRAFPLLSVVYFINVIDDKDLHFWKRRQHLPRGKVNWSEMRKNNDVYSFLCLRLLLGRSRPHKWIWRRFNAEVSCNIVRFPLKLYKCTTSPPVNLKSTCLGQIYAVYFCSISTLPSVTDFYYTDLEECP